MTPTLSVEAFHVSEMLVCAAPLTFRPVGVAGALLSPLTVNVGSYTAVYAGLTTRQRPGDGVPDGTVAVIEVGELTVKLGEGVS